MLHEPASSCGPDNAAAYKMRFGFWMFIFYGLIYAGFVVINIVNPLLMEKILFFGLDLAVVYGFGLIMIALIFALIYNYFCSKKEVELEFVEENGGAQ